MLFQYHGEHSDPVEKPLKYRSNQDIIPHILVKIVYYKVLKVLAETR